jgi:hypothetical protein
MQDIGLDVVEAARWFVIDPHGGTYLVRVSPDVAAQWPAAFARAIRRCYLTDATLRDRAQATGMPPTALIAARLPDPGSVMSGDFGEIIAYVYHAVSAQPTTAFGPKKWRLKQDRRKPAPHSDVIHFVLPEWPDASAADVLICSEVKTKATDGVFDPIGDAIIGRNKDRTSRLTTTLVWLRERALMESLGNVQLEHIQRFIDSIDHPSYVKK